MASSVLLLSSFLSTVVTTTYFSCFEIGYNYYDPEAFDFLTTLGTSTEAQQRCLDNLDLLIELVGVTKPTHYTCNAGRGQGNLHLYESDLALMNQYFTGLEFYQNPARSDGKITNFVSLRDCVKNIDSLNAQFSLAVPSPPASPPSPPASPPPPASPTGVCGDGTALDAVTRKCEVSLGSATEVLDGKVEVVLDEFTEVVGGKCAVACSDNRRLEEAQEEGAQEAAAASIVDGLLARHPDFLAKLRRASDEEAIKMLLKLGQDFRLPALA